MILKTSMMRTIIFLTWWGILMVVFAADANAFQPRTVEGLVTAVDGSPLEAVSVKVKGTEGGVSTDQDGRFRIRVPDGRAVLLFSRLGYDELEFMLADQAKITVALTASIDVLDEVMVIGYGEVSRRDLTGSVGSVNMDDLQKAPVRSFEEALAGRVAGVQVVSNDGQPGAASTITIRGNSSISQDNSPLYVIDGFPMENPDNNALNPSEIESIEVLKDASSTAIYGSRGTNGVIIITTKKGKSQSPKLNYEAFAGTQQNIKLAELLSPYEFVKYQLELSPDLMGERYIDDASGIDLDYYRDVEGIDWQKQTYQTAPMHSHHLNLMGGNQNTQYTASMSYFGQEGLIKYSGFNRYQGRMSLEQQVHKKLKIGGNVNYAHTKSYGSAPANPDVPSSTASVLFSVWGYRPLGGLRTSIDDLIEMPIDPEVDNSADFRYNPILSIENELDETFGKRFYVNVYGLYKFNNYLSLKISGGYTDRSDRRNRFYNSRTKYGDINNVQGRNRNGPNGAIDNVERMSLLNENVLSYNRRFNKLHQLNALVGFTVQHNSVSSYGYDSRNLPNESLGIDGLDQGTAYAMRSSNTVNNMLSYLARINYSLSTKYLFTFSIRADGSSKFATGNKWGYFPSGAFAWKLDEERFLKDVQSISQAKLRLSYGETGNNRVGDFAYQSTLSFPLINNYPFNNVYYVGAIPTALGNNQLTWETTKMFDTGLDFSMFDNRLGVVVDYYDKETRDLLLNADLPPSSGFERGFKNIGSVRNYGWEFAVNTGNVVREDFDWTTSFNISFNRNRVLSLTENQTNLMTNMTWEYNYNNIPLYSTQLNQPIGMFYGYRWLGNYQYEDFDEQPDGSYVLKAGIADNGSGRSQPGDIKYLDVNGDGTVNAEDRVIIGNPHPNFIAGLSNNFRYRAFDLHVFIQGSYGNDVVNANRLIFEGSLNMDQNQFASWVNRWTPDNPTNELFRTKGNGPNAYSSRIVEDASYLRLKTVSLGYTLISPRLRSLGLEQVRLYLSAQNLLTITNYSGFDPEVAVRYSTLTPGFDYTAYPRSRTVVFGLNASF